MKFHLFLPILLLSAKVSAADNALESGLELNYGQISVKAAKDTEINKSGEAKGGSVFLRNALGNGRIHLGLGYQSAKVASKGEQRGIVTQDFEAGLPFIDLRYGFNIAESLQIGPAIRTFYGKGSNYDVKGIESNSASLNAGPIIDYTRRFEKWAVGINAQMLFDLNIPKRMVRSTLLGVNLTRAIGKSQEKTVSKTSLAPPELVKALPAADTQILPMPDPPAPALVSFELGADFFQFEKGKSQMQPEALAKLQKIGAGLGGLGDSIGRIAVDGHTDASGLPSTNMKLSQARADSVCEVLVGQGVSRSLLSCEGHGSNKPLPGVDQNDSKNRRVEMKFQGSDQQTSEKIQQIFTEALK